MTKLREFIQRNRIIVFRVILAVTALLLIAMINRGYHLVARAATARFTISLGMTMEYWPDGADFLFDITEDGEEIEA